METASGTPYRIPTEKMQDRRRQNLGNYLLRLDLSEADKRELARVSMAGCADALAAGDTGSALVFARFWAHYADYDVTAKGQANILTAEDHSNMSQ